MASANWLTVASTCLILIAACSSSDSGGSSDTLNDANTGLELGLTDLLPPDAPDPGNDVADWLGDSQEILELVPEVCPAGAPCDDNEPCTHDDKCDGTGNCIGTAYACLDDRECTMDECLGDGQCMNNIEAGFCLIGGTCYVEGEPEPGLQCSICKPAKDATGWANVEGEACDDANACTQNDACSMGLCKGLPVNCDDNNVCTADDCEAKAGCSSVPVEGPCDDGDECTVGETCADGTCVGGEPICGSECEEDVDCAPFEDSNLCNGLLHCKLEAAPHVCEVDPNTVVECSTELNSDCLAYECQPESGICAPVVINQDGPCDDENECTAPDTCLDGICVGLEMPNCGAGGTMLAEGFEGDFPPPGWGSVGTFWDKSDVAHDGTGAAWHLAGKADDRLVSAPINLTGMNEASLAYWENIEPGEQVTNYAVEVSTDGGVAWGPPYYVGPQESPWQKTEIDLSMYAGLIIRVGWRYVASNQFITPGIWRIDDVEVIAQ